MCSNYQKLNLILVTHNKNCPIIASDIDTPTAQKAPIKLVIVKEWMEGVADKQILSFDKGDLDFTVESSKSFLKIFMKRYVHRRRL